MSFTHSRLCEFAKEQKAIENAVAELKAKNAAAERHGVNEQSVMWPAQAGERR